MQLLILYQLLWLLHPVAIMGVQNCCRILCKVRMIFNTVRRFQSLKAMYSVTFFCCFLLQIVYTTSESYNFDQLNIFCNCCCQVVSLTPSLKLSTRAFYKHAYYHILMIYTHWEDGFRQETWLSKGGSICSNNIHQ